MNGVLSKELDALNIASALVAGDTAAISRLFSELGSANAFLSMEPVGDEINCANIRNFLSYYRLQSNEFSILPRWSEFMLREVKPMLGNMHVLSFTNEEQGLRYEIYGTNIAARYNRDLTNTLLPTAGNQLPVLFHGLFLGSIKSEKPIYTFHQPPENSHITGCERLILPYANDNGNFHRLVVAHQPARTARGQVGGVL